MYFIDLKCTCKWLVDLGVECSARLIRFSASNGPARFDGKFVQGGGGVVRAMIKVS